MAVVWVMTCWRRISLLNVWEPLPPVVWYMKSLGKGSDFKILERGAVEGDPSLIQSNFTRDTWVAEHISGGSNLFIVVFFGFSIPKDIEIDT